MVCLVEGLVLDWLFCFGAQDILEYELFLFLLLRLGATRLRELYGLVLLGRVGGCVLGLLDSRGDLGVGIVVGWRLGEYFCILPLIELIIIHLL